MLTKFDRMFFYDLAGKFSLSHYILTYVVLWIAMSLRNSFQSIEDCQWHREPYSTICSEIVIVIISVPVNHMAFIN